MRGNHPALEIRIGHRCFRLPVDSRGLSVTYRQDQARAKRLLLEAQALPRLQRARFEVPGEPITVLALSGDQMGSSDAIAAFQQRDEVFAARPTFVLGVKRVALTNRVTVKGLQGGAGLDRRLAEACLTVLERQGDLRVCRVPTGADPVEVAAALGETGWVEYAEPDLITIIPPPPPVPEARAFDGSTLELQQAFRQIAADVAWGLQPARPDIHVAVLDDGLDLAHPALRATVMRSYDALNDSEPARPNPWDAHGTACAGLIAGRDEATGFRGIAAGCSVLAVRIAQSPQAGRAWSTSASAVRRGIAWAVGAGADVLSCSWGIAPSQSVIDALFEAQTGGRGGRGCVLVFAAGNDGGPVAFPATVDGVVAVSGVNDRDQFKTRTTSDGETWWASNQGPEVDIAAPCVGLLTTDNAGVAGKTPGDYYSRFNGTSAAAPLVAAAAALVLSSRPELRGQEVRERLLTQADKVGATPFASGRNDQLGFGRLNVARALSPGSARPDESIGVLGRLDLGLGAQIFYLEQEGRRPALIAGADPAALLPRVGTTVAFTFGGLTPTLLGEVLTGFAFAPTARTARAAAPPPGEVRLPTPEEDLFGR